MRYVVNRRLAGQGSRDVFMWTIFTTVQLLEGFLGLGTVPAAWGFQDSDIDQEKHLASIAETDRSDGDGFLHGTKVNVFLELSLEKATSRLQKCFFSFAPIPSGS